MAAIGETSATQESDIVDLSNTENETLGQYPIPTIDPEKLNSYVRDCNVKPKHTKTAGKHEEETIGNAANNPRSPPSDDARGQRQDGPKLVATRSRDEQPYTVFSRGRRRLIIAMAAAAGFVSPVTGNIYFPALNALSADLHVSSQLINLSLTTYMIFQGLAPTFMGNLADTAGRRPAYLIGFIIYLGATIGLALQTSYPALLVLRALQSSGSSSVIALASGVAADVSPPAERGTYLGWVNSGSLVGPAVGPIFGGVLAQFLSWRANFWFLVILVALLMIPIVLLFPETSRNVVGNGSIPPQPWNRCLLDVVRERRMKRRVDASASCETRDSRRLVATNAPAGRNIRFPNPLSTLIILKEKDVALLLLFNCLVYTSYFSITSSLPYLFARTYNFNVLQVGLSFIPYGIGCVLAPTLNGRIMDRRFRQVATSIGVEVVKGRATDTRHFPLERVRLPITLALILLGNTTLLCYGWASLSIFLSSIECAPIMTIFCSSG